MRGSPEVREDRRIQVAPDVRRAWTRDMQRLAAPRDSTRALAARVKSPQTTELASRATRLYSAADDEVGPLTQLQREQEAFLRRMLEELGR